MRELLQYEYSRTLKQVADFLEVSYASVNPNSHPNFYPNITGLTLNSHQVTQGDLFVALQGAHTHGISFVEEAIKSGAVAILTDHSGYEYLIKSPHKTTPCLATRDVRGALGPLASWFFGAPSHNLRLYGITGTNGKTTVSYLLEHIWKENRRETGLMGTVEVKVGADRYPSIRTTMEAPELQALLATYSERHIQNVVMEVSSHSLALHRVDGSRFATVAFTNLSQDHLDFHGDMDSYFKAKKRLFTLSFAENAIINVDNEWGLRLYQEASIPALDLSLTNRKASWHLVEQLPSSSHGMQFTVRGPNGVLLDVRTPLVGEYNIANAIMAIALAVDSGIDPLAAADALSNAHGAPGRLERVEHPDGVSVLVDYAHSPDAVERVISAVKPNTSGRIIGILGCGGDRDSSKRPLMGKALAEGCDIAIFTSDNPRSESAAEIIEQMQPSRFENVEVEIDRRKAIERGLSIALKGDVLLILGKGHESGQEIKGVVHPFNDRDIAQELIGKNK